MYGCAGAGGGGVWRACMDAVARWTQRAILPVTTGIWALVLVIMGLLLMFEFPSRFGPMVGMWGTRAFWAAGALSLAMGEFILAVEARRVFPRAHPRVAGAFEIFPWLALGCAALLGGVLWLV